MRENGETTLMLRVETNRHAVLELGTLNAYIIFTSSLLGVWWPEIECLCLGKKCTLIYT